MEYILAPNELMHSREWKTHKYIKKTMSKGKWVYQYAKNKIRGGHVTNKNGKTQYSPNIKSNNWGTNSWIPGASSMRDITYLSEPINGYDLANQGINKYVNSRIMNMKFSDKQAVTNRSPYPYDNDGNWVDKQYAPNYKKSKGTPYSPTQSSRAASSRHYTPDEKKKK
jgi:hypothetical protein